MSKNPPINRRQLSQLLSLLPWSGPLLALGCKTPGQAAQSQVRDAAAAGGAAPANFLTAADPTFNKRCEIFNTLYDNTRPRYVAVCRSEADVAAAVQYARAQGLDVGIRGGGHSYTGQSLTSGVMLDLSLMNQVVLDPTTQTAVVGAGCRQIDVAHVLAAAGLALPYGMCPQVGVSGFILGGGLGAMKRTWGAMIDHVLEIRLVDVNGRTIVASPTQSPDLFWALCGGGHASFGVATSFTLKALPAPQITYYEQAWNWSDAQAVATAWFQWIKTLPRTVGARFEFDLDGPSGYHQIRILGSSTESVDTVRGLLGKLPPPRDSTVVSEDFFANVLRWEGCESWVACHLDPNNFVPETQQTFVAKSRFTRLDVTQATIAQTMAAFAAYPAVTGFKGGVIIIDADGGAIDDVAPDATAFVHRGCQVMIQYMAYLQTGNTSALDRANQWLSAIYQAWTPAEIEECYQNYTDPLLANWAQAYYGANLARLQQIKAQYDPTGFFKGKHII